MYCWLYAMTTTGSQEWVSSSYKHLCTDKGPVLLHSQDNASDLSQSKSAEMEINHALKECKKTVLECPTA